MKTLKDFLADKEREVIEEVGSGLSAVEPKINELDKALKDADIEKRLELIKKAKANLEAELIKQKRLEAIEQALKAKTAADKVPTAVGTESATN